MSHFLNHQLHRWQKNPSTLFVPYHVQFFFFCLVFDTFYFRISYFQGPGEVAWFSHLNVLRIFVLSCSRQCLDSIITNQDTKLEGPGPHCVFPKTWLSMFRPGGTLVSNSLADKIRRTSSVHAPRGSVSRTLQLPVKIAEKTHSG